MQLDVSYIRSDFQVFNNPIILLPFILPISFSKITFVFRDDYIHAVFRNRRTSFAV